ncbi:MAG: hypothetical protein M3367_19050 [Acidobacteriota bacterium]|nr:hypothetical protein [Acidobacteriota bacterium]
MNKSALTITITILAVCLSATAFANDDIKGKRGKTKLPLAPPVSCEAAVWLTTGKHSASRTATVRRISKPCPEVIYINGRRVLTAHYYMCRGRLPRSAANRRCVCSNRRTKNKVRRG